MLLICCAAFIILPWPLFTYLASGNVPYAVLVLIQIGIAIVISLYSGAGPAAIATFFGPVMLLWFAALAVAGLWHIGHCPAVLFAFNPWHGMSS